MRQRNRLGLTIVIHRRLFAAQNYGAWLKHFLLLLASSLLDIEKYGIIKKLWKDAVSITLLFRIIFSPFVGGLEVRIYFSMSMGVIIYKVAYF